MFENVRIKERLTKAFVMVAAITAIGAVVGLAAMLVMSNRYSSALVNYGFSQGDIGKAMITFANTRSATRGIIGFDEQGLVDDAMTEHDEQKAKFENYFATVGDVVTTSEEKALYQQISDKLPIIGIVLTTVDNRCVLVTLDFLLLDQAFFLLTNLFKQYACRRSGGHL